MPISKKGKGKQTKRVTRFTFEDIIEPRTPETGHTTMLPAEASTATIDMDSFLSVAMRQSLEHDGASIEPQPIELDPAMDPMLLWAGKRRSRDIAVLPLQRNEIVSESRIAQIVRRYSEATNDGQLSLFADQEKAARSRDKSKRIEFYAHEEGWKNKLICGDSMQVTQSLLNYEGLAGAVQTIYVDPPYGIKYSSNFQQRIDSTKVDDKERADDALTIKAYRDTWVLGIHSYLSYLQERLYLCRSLLAPTGSIFLQISDEHVHLVRVVMDEVFGKPNYVGQITFQKTGSQETALLGSTVDYLLWYAKDKPNTKYRQLYLQRMAGDLSLDRYDQVELPDGSSRRLTAPELRGEVPVPGKRFQSTSLLSDGETNAPQEFEFLGKVFKPKAGNHWKTTVPGLQKLAERGRILLEGNTLRYKRYADDFDYVPVNDRWESMQIGKERDYVVQTAESVVDRCVLMTTDPGDLVFDPTCGSGTTAACAEKLGRRWITCDTSRIAVNVARRRLLSCTFEHYATKGATVSSGFIYKTVDRVTLKSLAYDMEPEKVELVDKPEVDRSAIRVIGPFEVMSLGRYSVEDWKGYVREKGSLENYIDVICRLYHRKARVQGSAGFLHAIIQEEHSDDIGLSIGPLTGRVTGRQIADAAQDGREIGIKEIHVLGWSFEANVGELKAALEAKTSVQIQLVMIRPDTLTEGLKIIHPDKLFSPFAMPEIHIHQSDGKTTVELKGIAVFDRAKRTTDFYRADSGYVSAWYLDEDYDDDCFVDCQMFFDFKKAPNIKAALKYPVPIEEYQLQLRSRPFTLGHSRQIAVKVIDVFGNESTIVKAVK
jgi:adenine-specific DNA-methyltransferase